MSGKSGGSVEIICGEMFSGKTEEMIRRLQRAKIAKQRIQVFKRDMDTRYSREKVVSHAGLEFKATPVEDSYEIRKNLSQETTVIAIDEVQFFDDGIIDLIDELADDGKRVIVTGLDMNFRGEPFGCVPDIMAKADKVDKIHAICAVCGKDARRTQRLINGKPANYNDPLVLVGASDFYEARCREHHEVPKG